MHKFIIFVGGFGDTLFLGPVYKYARRYRKNFQGDDVHYFSWSQTEQIARTISTRTPRMKLVVVGHSYGGDTVMKIASQAMSRIDLLITIDPVGRNQLTSAQVLDAVGTWLNIQAAPLRLSPFDVMANVGGKYSEIIAHHSYICSCGHLDIDAMMKHGNPSAEYLMQV